MKKKVFREKYNLKADNLVKDLVEKTNAKEIKINAVKKATKKGDK